MDETERQVVALELACILEQAELLEGSMKKLEGQIEELVRQHPEGTKLQEMPGIGPFVAAVLVAELLPLARHATEPETATYAGATPLSRSSGKRKRSRLTRRTNKRVLRVQYLSALAAIKDSAIDRAYYEKKRADYEGHEAAHTKAILALARQRCKVIYKLLTTDVRYDKEILIRSHLERREAA